MSNYNNYSNKSFVTVNNKKHSGYHSFCNYYDYLNKAWGLPKMNPIINQNYNFQNEKEKVRGILFKSDGSLYTRCEHNHSINELLEEINQNNSDDVVEDDQNNTKNIASTSTINKPEKLNQIEANQNNLINYLFPHCIKLKILNKNNEEKLNKNKWLRIEEEKEEDIYYEEKQKQFYIDKEGNKWNFLKIILNQKDLEFIIKQNFLQLWDEKSDIIRFW
uniref:Uncharacterized protein n=1 Tax=Meloidogyne hapla TaxID=6305 RepID=A0A1I8BDM8_MELHA